MNVPAAEQSRARLWEQCGQCQDGAGAPGADTRAWVTVHNRDTGQGGRQIKVNAGLVRESLWVS